MSDNQNTQFSQNDSQQKRSNKMLWITLAVISLLVIAVVTIFAFNNGIFNSKKTVETSAPEVKAPVVYTPSKTKTAEAWNGKITLQPKNLDNVSKVVTEDYGCGNQAGIVVFTKKNTYSTTMYVNNLNFAKTEAQVDSFTRVEDFLNGKTEYQTMEEDAKSDGKQLVSAFRTGCSGFYSYKFMKGDGVDLPGADISRTVYAIEGNGSYGSVVARIFARKGDDFIVAFKGFEFNYEAIAKECGLETTFDQACFSKKLQENTELNDAIKKGTKELAETFAL
jgi:hypothetical protein